VRISEGIDFELLGKRSSEALWSYFLHIGYLTATPGGSSDVWNVRIPSFSLRNGLVSNILSKWFEPMNLSVPFNGTVDALLRNDLGRLKFHLTRLIPIALDFYRTVFHQDMTFIGSFILGLFATLPYKGYYIELAAQTHFFGRPCVFIVPKDIRNRAVLLQMFVPELPKELCIKELVPAEQREFSEEIKTFLLKSAHNALEEIEKEATFGQMKGRASEVLIVCITLYKNHAGVTGLVEELPVLSKEGADMI